VAEIDEPTELLNALLRLRAARARGEPLEKLVDDVLDELPDLGAARQPLPLVEALDAGLRPKRKQHGRHDKTRPPSGWEVEGGRLWLTETPSEWGGYTEEEKQIASAIAQESASWLSEWVAGPRGTELRAIFALIFGYPWGEEWRKVLEQELEDDALIRKQSEMSKAARQPVLEQPLGDNELHARILARCNEHASAPPQELTVQELAQMRAETTLGGGGRTKTASGTVSAFVKRLRGNS
jgi:hypothetical protein